MIVCGPVALRERMAHPTAALAIATASDRAAREQAWSELAVSSPSRAPNGVNSGTAQEPAARRRG
jgi:hypothetical protein